MFTLSKHLSSVLLTLSLLSTSSPVALGQGMYDPFNNKNAARKTRKHRKEKQRERKLKFIQLTREIYSKAAKNAKVPNTDINDWVNLLTAKGDKQAAITVHQMLSYCSERDGVYNDLARKIIDQLNRNEERRYYGIVREFALENGLPQDLRRSALKYLIDSKDRQGVLGLLEHQEVDESAKTYLLSNLHRMGNGAETILAHLNELYHSKSWSQQLKDRYSQAIDRLGQIEAPSALVEVPEPAVLDNKSIGDYVQRERLRRRAIAQNNEYRLNASTGGQIDRVRNQIIGNLAVQKVQESEAKGDDVDSVLTGLGAEQTGRVAQELMDRLTETYSREKAIKESKQTNDPFKPQAKLGEQEKKALENIQNERREIRSTLDKVLAHVKKFDRSNWVKFKEYYHGPSLSASREEIRRQGKDSPWALDHGLHKKMIDRISTLRYASGDNGLYCDPNKYLKLEFNPLYCETGVCHGNEIDLGRYMQEDAKAATALLAKMSDLGLKLISEERLATDKEIPFYLRHIVLEPVTAFEKIFESFEKLKSKIEDKKKLSESLGMMIEGLLTSIPTSISDKLKKQFKQVDLLKGTSGSREKFKKTMIDELVKFAQKQDEVTKIFYKHHRVFGLQDQSLPEGFLTVLEESPEFENELATVWYSNKSILSKKTVENCIESNPKFDFDDYVTSGLQGLMDVRSVARTVLSKKYINGWLKDRYKKSEKELIEEFEKDARWNKYLTHSDAQDIIAKGLARFRLRDKLVDDYMRLVEELTFVEQLKAKGFSSTSIEKQYAELLKQVDGYRCEQISKLPLGPEPQASSGNYEANIARYNLNKDRKENCTPSLLNQFMTGIPEMKVDLRKFAKIGQTNALSRMDGFMADAKKEAKDKANKKEIQKAAEEYLANYIGQGTARWSCRAGGAVAETCMNWTKKMYEAGGHIFAGLLNSFDYVTGRKADEGVSRAAQISLNLMRQANEVGEPGSVLGSPEDFANSSVFTVPLKLNVGLIAMELPFNMIENLTSTIEVGSVMDAYNVDKETAQEMIRSESHLKVSHHLTNVAKMAASMAMSLPKTAVGKMGVKATGWTLFKQQLKLAGKQAGSLMFLSAGGALGRKLEQKAPQKRDKRDKSGWLIDDVIEVTAETFDAMANSGFTMGLISKGVSYASPFNRGRGGIATAASVERQQKVMGLIDVAEGMGDVAGVVDKIISVSEEVYKSDKPISAHWQKVLGVGLQAFVTAWDLGLDAKFGGWYEAIANRGGRWYGKAPTDADILGLANKAFKGSEFEGLSDEQKMKKVRALITILGHANLNKHDSEVKAAQDLKLNKGLNENQKLLLAEAKAAAQAMAKNGKDAQSIMSTVLEILSPSNLKGSKEFTREQAAYLLAAGHIGVEGVHSGFNRAFDGLNKKDTAAVALILSNDLDGMDGRLFAELDQNVAQMREARQRAADEAAKKADEDINARENQLKKTNEDIGKETDEAKKQQLAKKQANLEKALAVAKANKAEAEAIINALSEADPVVKKFMQDHPSGYLHDLALTLALHAKKSITGESLNGRPLTKKEAEAVAQELKNSRVTLERVRADVRKAIDCANAKRAGGSRRTSGNFEFPGNAPQVCSR